jgi:outer membrane protein assembly factor BamA
MRRPLALLILLCSPLTALRLAAQIDRGLPDEQIRINQATFDSAPNLPPSAREKIVAELRSVFFDSPAGAVDLAQKITRRRYQENGYHDVRVTADSHRVFDDGIYVWYDLQVHVASEGVQYRLNDVAFARNTAIRSEQLRPMISLEPGAIFNSTALADGITAVRHANHDKGYVNVAIFPRLEFDPKRPDISVLLDIDEGHVFTFDNVAVAGVPIEQVKAFVDVLSAWHGQIMTPRVLEQMFASLKPILPPCADPMRNSTPRFKEKTAQVTLVLDFQECGTNSLDPNKPAVNCCPQ